MQEILKYTQQQSINSSQLIDQLGVRHAETTKNKVQVTSMTDDFLKKIKQQHDSLKQSDQRVGPKAPDSELIKQQIGSIHINSPKYIGKDQKSILAEIMSKQQRDYAMRQQEGPVEVSDPLYLICK